MTTFDSLIQQTVRFEEDGFAIDADFPVTLTLVGLERGIYDEAKAKFEEANQVWEAADKEDEEEKAAFISASVDFVMTQAAIAMTRVTNESYEEIMDKFDGLPTKAFNLLTQMAIYIRCEAEGVRYGSV